MCLIVPSQDILLNLVVLFAKTWGANIHGGKTPKSSKGSVLQKESFEVSF